MTAEHSATADSRSAPPGMPAWNASGPRMHPEPSALRWELLECQPASAVTIAGLPHHVVCVSLGDGVLSDEGDGERLCLKPGFVAVIPQGASMRLRCLTPARLALLFLDAQFLQGVAARDFGLAASGFGLRFSRRECDVAMLTIAQALRRETRSEAAGGRVYADSLAGILAVHLLRDYVRHSEVPELLVRMPPAVSRAIEFIQANYAEGIGLKDIAAAAHVSPYHLSRLFKRAIGYAPYQYLIRARVTGARNLLSGGRRRSLAEVAAAVGFVDQSHLTRHFKRAFGVTPGQAE